MTMTQIKSIAADCGKTHRWAQIKNDFHFSWRDRFTTLRIVAVGKKFVRCMDARGTIVRFTPEQISKAW